MNSRKLIFLLFIITSFFAVIILVWYFFFRTPTSNPTINTPTNPLGTSAPSLRGSEFVQNTDNNQTVEVIPSKDPLLIKVWNKPTAGFTFTEQTILVNSTSTKIIKGTSTEVIIQKKATSSRMFFVDRMTGHIYGYDLENKKIYQITNTTIAGIYDAYFLNDGTSVIMRYLDENNSIVSVLISVPLVAEDSSPVAITKKTYLPNNVTSISVSDSSKSASYFVPSSFGGSIYSINNNRASSLFSTTISELNINYSGETPYINTNPSAFIKGFSINTKTGERVLGDKTGLITLPANNGNDFLASMWTTSGLASFIFSKKTGDTNVLQIKTLASKCTWGKSSYYVVCGVPQTTGNNPRGLPDAWYQGFIQFSDDIYLINNKTDNSQRNIFRFTDETSEKIDLVKPKMNSAYSYLGFINKQGGNLWLLNVKDLIN